MVGESGGGGKSLLNKALVLLLSHSLSLSLLSRVYKTILALVNSTLACLLTRCCVFSKMRFIRSHFIVFELSIGEWDGWLFVLCGHTVCTALVIKSTSSDLTAQFKTSLLNNPVAPSPSDD